MKKLFLGLALLVTAACTNPSMERGFDSLNASLADLETILEELGIPQMIEDLNSINSSVDQMIADVEEYSLKMEEFNQQVLEMQARLEAMLIQVQGITTTVEGMTVTVGGMATSEQMQDLLAQVEDFQAGVDMLVAIADYDYDGVANALDKCPDTLLSEINNVNSDGCAPSQIED